MPNKGKLLITKQEIPKKSKPSVSKFSLDAWFKINFPYLNPVPIVDRVVELWLRPLDSLADFYIKFRKRGRGVQN